MRLYTPVWEQLKKLRFLKVSVHPAQYNTVRKGVIQEKWKDAGFRLVNPNDTYRLIITYDESTQIMSLELRARCGLEEIVV